MRLVITSDTHRAGRELTVPDGDVFIHCGDLTYRGTFQESVPELEWIHSLPHKYKIFICGNHELGWDHTGGLFVKDRCLEMFPDLIYLENTEAVINGIKFWGSPSQPHFHSWAFQKARGEQLQRHWAQIPDDTDVLITHGPPLGFGDINKHDERFGDEDLFKRVMEVKPQVHCYGHAHHGYGSYFFEGVQFINAAACTEEYKCINPPIVVDVS